MAHEATEMRLARYAVAGGIALGFVGVALPDGNPGAPRAIATAISLALIGVGVYLGAPRPSQPPVE